MAKIANTLCKLIDEGNNASSETECGRWASKVKAFLSAIDLFLDSYAFEKLNSTDIWDMHALRLGYLEGLLAKTRVETNTDSKINSEETSEISEILPLSKKHNTRKVFLVHGHDNEAKETTARFIEKLKLQPIILHEQANSGRTIIEKFENYSDDIAFAVVLLTPDDVGAEEIHASNLKPRARQNVIMELGYFIGKLSRLRVCALYKGGVELPSDYQGILYIEMDLAGAWKSKLAQEFVQAKLPINLEALLSG